MALSERAGWKIYAGADPFGSELKEAVVAHLQSLPGLEIVDLGTDPKYYSVASVIGRHVSSSPDTTRGLLVCGTGSGVAMFANKYPGVYATTCLTPDDAINSRSINSCNVLTLSGLATAPSDAIKIVDAWLNTPFKAPCPASGGEPWGEDIQAFLDAAPAEMEKIGKDETGLGESTCAICCLRKGMEFQPVDIMPGGEMKIVRESPTSAYVKFKAGSVEPAHHHTFGHDLVVIKGTKKVWNLTKKESYDLTDGDFLFTPAGDVHRVKYFTDTEFFIRWDGHWDIFLDEDLDTARAAIDKEIGAGN
ncbi:DNA-damage-repair/toleration protein DRT102 [Rhynchospora pubera]|uniref:DNA-damage-repair/toleration protein DRT102 n=1 Tax=Rhynchospora pubera TaxID=906938 RepID=A0AAV8GUN7_9POAL|nr:DNA-damage-repair/toleration protein DRT102 [Rhynchospora pubera]